MDLKKRINSAAGRCAVDVLLKNASVVSVLAGKIVKTDIAISDGVIVGFGEYKAKKVVNLKGSFVSSGFIDSHIHLESSLIVPANFAKEALVRGTTAVVADPHEIANVWGKKGINWMLQATKDLPIDVYFTLPSCVPASRFETSGARLGAKELKEFAQHPRVVGMGEMMDFPAVIAGKPSVIAKTKLVHGMRVEGHAPSLTGKDLYAYIMANISSDHESTTRREGEEKLFAGLHLMIREGSTAKNLRSLLPVVTKANSHRCMFCSDDLSASELVKEGHVDRIIRMAVKIGLPPLRALQMATNNTFYYFRIKEKKGAVAVGYAADLIVFDNMMNIKPRMVFKAGKLVAQNGKILVPCKHPKLKSPLSVRTKGLSSSQLRIQSHGKHIRVINIIPEQIVTHELCTKAKIKNGLVSSDIKRDILKIAVVERHKNTGNAGVAFVKGFGLKKGAIASSVAHDSHNIIVVGATDEDMVCAVDNISKMNGGMVVVCDGKVLAKLPLPIAGLMSDKPAEVVANAHDDICNKARELGCKLNDPFLQLSFVALPVIPELKITDKGLFSTKKFNFVSLFV